MGSNVLVTVADEADITFKNEHIEVLIIEERTYFPDYFVHQTLNHLPEDLPLVCYAT